MERNTVFNQIDRENLPQHVAIIMDGNGRWAKQQGKPRIFGHKNGVQSVREVSEAAAELGIRFLTLYAFSAENWSRPKREVAALMGLLVQTIHQETDTLSKNNIRLRAIGKIDKLPDKTLKALQAGIRDTRNNDRMDLVLALNYSSRTEITDAVRKISSDIMTNKLQPEDISESIISGYLATQAMPDPELLIRTSGEMRLSNFLLWQSAYTEFYFTPKMWPDFRKDDFLSAILEYQNRERRFGKISEQIV